MADARDSPLYTDDLYALHRHLVEVHEQCNARRIADPARTCKELWDARRARNVVLCEMDESGSGQGWSAASRLVLLAVQIRSVYRVQCNYLGDNAMYAKWASSLMLAGAYPIHEYEVSDVLIALRTLARNWISADFWRYGVRDVYLLLEALLHDLNLRLEDCLARAPADVPIPESSLRECVDTTAMMHNTIITLMDRAQNCVQLTPIALVQWEHEGSTDWTRDWTDAVAHAREHLRAEFLAISGMGRLTENVSKMLRALLLPLDVFSRFRSLENISTESHIVASQRVLSIAEIQWLDVKMPSLQPGMMLDASPYRPNHAWLFEASCIFQLCNVLFCQYNAGFAWFGECVLIDRNACTDTVWAQAIQRRPCILMYGIHFIVAWKEHRIITRNIYEAVLVWALMVRKNRYTVRISPQETYNLVKEITLLIDKSFPHLAQ